MIDPVLGQLLGHGMKGEPLCPNCRRNVGQKFSIQCAARLASWNQLRSSGLGDILSNILPKALSKDIPMCEESAYSAVEAVAQVRYLLGKEVGLLDLLHPGGRLDLLKDITKWFHDKDGCRTRERLEAIRDRTKARAFKHALGEDAMCLLLFWEQFVHGLVLRELQRLTADFPDNLLFERDMLLEKLRDKVAAIQTEFKEDPLRFNNAEEKLLAFRYDPRKQEDIDAMWEKRRSDGVDVEGIDISKLLDLDQTEDDEEIDDE
jgi:hypothetical protein